MADLATLQTRLTEAEGALHALSMGQRVVEVWHDGRKIRYDTSSKSDLQGYIDSLNRAIADIGASAESTLPRRRYIPVVFG